MFEAYVTNLGLYPERGAGAGEYLKFPTTVEEVQALFSRIGIDGKQYEEYFITDYDSDILGLTDHLGEYESLDELNYLAHLLEEMTPAELEKLEAVMDAGEYTSSVKDLMNLHYVIEFDMEFFASAVDTLKVLVMAIGCGLGAWGIVNLLEGYGADNPASNAHIR